MDDVFFGMSSGLKSNMVFCMKRKVFNQCVLLALTLGTKNMNVNKMDCAIITNKIAKYRNMYARYSSKGVNKKEPG